MSSISKTSDVKKESKTEDEVDETTKTEFMFIYQVRDFSSLASKPEIHASNPCRMLNLDWRIKIEKSQPSLFDSSKDVLGVSVWCEDPSKSELWSCIVNFRLTILSQKECVADYSLGGLVKQPCLFSSLSRCWGYNTFITLDKIKNPENGFIKNDVIKLKAHIVADPPKNVDVNHRIENPKTASDVLFAFEKGINKKIVPVCRSCDELKVMKAALEKISSESMEMLKADLNKRIDSVVDELSAKMVAMEKKNSPDKLHAKIDELHSKMLVYDEQENFTKISLIEEKLDNVISLLGDRGKNKHEQKVENGEKIQPPATSTELINSPSEVKKIVPILPKDEEGTAQNANHISFSGNVRHSNENSPNSFVEHDPSISFFVDAFENALSKYRSKEETNTNFSCNIVHQTNGNEIIMKDGGITESASVKCNEKSKKSKKSKKQLPNDGKVLEENTERTKRFKINVYFIGKDNDGETVTYKPNCLEELDELKKKYKDFEILEPSQGFLD